MPQVRVGGVTVRLSKNDFLAEGGEGAVYAKGRIAYKIYKDPRRMIPAGKIKELSVLTLPNIIMPKDIIRSRNKPIGYTMRYVSRTAALCQMFTRSFKDRNGITPKISLALLRNMQETIQHIHDKGVLIVDLNEMNFLSDSKFKEIYFIDVDSYQTSSYPATALMDSVKDRHSKSNQFNKNTDWFSFAIVSFQLLVGIHPYKGKHPSLKGFDERMMKNISVFNSDVRIPKSCLPFDIIPENYRDWYKAVFEDGLRCPPPTEGGIVPELATVVTTISGSDNFMIKELFECDWDISGYHSSYDVDCVVGQGGLRLNTGKHIPFPMPCYVGYHGSIPLAARIENDLITIFNIKMQRPVDMNEISATDMMSTGGRIYAKYADKIMELQFLGSEYKPVVAAKVVGTVMEKATQLFSGVAIQNVLGTYYVSIFPESGSCVQHRLPDLDGYRIINAKNENGVLMVVVAKKGRYDRFVYSTADISKISNPRIVKDVQGTGLNFAVLDNGVCVSITDTEEVEIFNNKNVHKLKIIQDDAIHGGMRLFNEGNTILFSEGRKMFQLKMK